MELFRITKEKYSGNLIASGSANRWNKSGQKVIYAGSSRSLSTLEMLVHKCGIISSVDFKVMVISIPDDEKYLNQIRINMLPVNWRKMSEYSKLQEIGSEWYIKKESLVLKVPSVIIPYEFNYAINTVHPEFAKCIKLVRTEDCFWDERLS